MDSCPLCRPKNENILWQNEFCRVILAQDPDYPGYCRVIWRYHVKEMTDLAQSDRAHFMFIAYTVELVLRELVHPDKMNLASLGNQIPHLHWHVIPRFANDAHYPDPIWGIRKRDKRYDERMRIDLVDRLKHGLAKRLGNPSGS